MTDRDKIIETMAEAMFTADGHLGTWAEVVAFDTSFADRWRARAKTALTAYESHLQASGMAVVPGWQSIESAPKGRKVIVAYRNNLGHWRQVMARYFEPETLDSDETEDGFAPEGWYEESDTHENLLRTDEPPTFWRPLLPFPDDGKALMQEGSAEAQSAVAHPFTPVVQEKKDE